MKKPLIPFLAITFIIAIIVQVSMVPLNPLISEEMNKRAVLSANREIAKMSAKYDDYDTIYNSEDKTIYTRLIVKHDKPIDEYNAIDSAHSINYSFLQYEDEKSAQEAKIKYEEFGYEAEYDHAITLCSMDNWAYGETEATSTVDYYKTRIKSTVNVAVLDSGINYNHEIFNNRIVRTNLDFSGDKATSEIDGDGHGTMVASVIANSTPTNVKIASYKIFDKNGKGNSSMAVSALEYIEQLSNKPDVINCSFCTYGLGTIVDELIDEGITIVSSAGNDGMRVSDEPANNSKTITVAATNEYGKPVSFSNYGPEVDISAPGQNVMVANLNGGYSLVSGTSFSAPLVSSAAAIVIMEHKSYTPDQIKNEIQDNAIPFKRSSGYVGKYGVGILNLSNLIDATRCKPVKANYQSDVYHDDINVELSCDNSLVDIYYTTDNSLPTKANGTKYTEPIVIDTTTRVNAVAYAKAGTPFHSKFSTFDYYIFKNNESEFLIDDIGRIYAYLGSDKDIIIPEAINGIKPIAIDNYCFYNRDVESVSLPSTITDVLDYSFYRCANLKSINIENLSVLGECAFYGCAALTGDANFDALEYIQDYALAYTGIKSIRAPKCKTINNYVFYNCKAEQIILNSLTSYGNYNFENCSSLKLVYAPKITNLHSIISESNSIENLFVPSVNSITAFIYNDIKIYCGSLNGFSNYGSSNNNYSFICPSYSTYYISQYESHHIDSDSMIKHTNCSICQDDGLKFAFEFDESSIAFDFRKYADKVEYGFVYSYGAFNDDVIPNNNLRINASDKIYSITANNISKVGTTTSFNAVITDIDESYLDETINLRAYLCIDGMYFYSPVISSSFNEVTEVTSLNSNDNEIKSILGHEHNYTITIIEPNCFASGYTRYNCSICNDIYNTDYIRPLGHDLVFKNYKNGVFYYTCNICNGNSAMRTSELPDFEDYINASTKRGDKSMYLDFVPDGIINAKDFAKIRHLSKYGW